MISGPSWPRASGRFASAEEVHAEIPSVPEGGTTGAGGRGRALLLCARQELTLAVRSRWTQIFAIVFAMLASAVAWSGYILSGGRGVQDFARTSVSLVQLVTLLVPLAALIVGVMSFTSERGAAELLYSQPVGRATILSGQMLGVFAALVAAQLVGFGAAGVVIFSSGGSWGVGAYFVLFAASVFLTAIFVAAAAAASAGAVGRERVRALAIALVVWIFSVVLFDLAALGIASLLPSGHASRVLIVSVLVNPVDAVRTAALLATSGTTAFGAASLAFLRFTKGTTGAGIALAASVILWTIAPVLLATWRLKKRDL